MKSTSGTTRCYMQDNWRVNGRLTPTPGLRWDMNPAWTDPIHLINTFDVKNQAVVLASRSATTSTDGVDHPAGGEQFREGQRRLRDPQQAGLKSNNFFPSNMFKWPRRPRVPFLDGRKAFVLRGGYGGITSVPAHPLAVSPPTAFQGDLPVYPNSSA